MRVMTHQDVGIGDRSASSPAAKRHLAGIVELAQAARCRWRLRAGAGSSDRQGAMAMFEREPSSSINLLGQVRVVNFDRVCPD